ncbi:MAG: hypothetical protein QM775_30550 [Pirellulales bacterium]
MASSTACGRLGSDDHSFVAGHLRDFRQRRMVFQQQQHGLGVDRLRESDDLS